MAENNKANGQQMKDLSNFKLAVEQAFDHIIITDIDAKILYANKAAELVTGYSVEEIIGSRPSLWGGQMPLEFYKKMWHRIKEEKLPFSGKINNKRKNGENYIAETHIAPIFGDDGEIKFFVSIERDITKAEELDKAKSEFISLVAHQFRSPLTAIKWWLDMIESGDEGEVSDQLKKSLAEIRISNDDLMHLVEDFLTVARIEQELAAPEFKLTDLSPIIKTVLAELEQQIREKNIAVEREYDEADLAVVANDMTMRAVIQNLFSNAVKYTPQDGKINIKIKKSDTGLEITVADTGCGIPKSQQPRIFEKLFRADNVKAKGIYGTGLGLYIVKSLLDKVGGQIRFESEENKGTTFYVHVPPDKSVK